MPRRSSLIMDKHIAAVPQVPNAELCTMPGEAV